MKSIQFLKPDLKRILVLLIILSPLIIAFLITPKTDPEHGFWLIISILALILIIPFLYTSMIFFGGWDVGGGLFPSCAYSETLTFLIGSMFWYVISCGIVTIWDSLIESEYFGKNSKRYEKNAIIYLVIILLALVIIVAIVAVLE
ncbi:MAG: hypothetical protein PHT13_10195 [Methanosarcina sp.]|nr:hypothetical protein [Methanosarcina sp.]